MRFATIIAMSQPLAITLLQSTTTSAPNAGTAVDIGTLRRTVVVALAVTGFTPVDQDPLPSVTVTVETRTSSSAPWRAVDSLVVEGVGAYPFAVGGCDREVRLRWSLTNMTSATFEASGVAHVTYCDPADLNVPEHAIAEISLSWRASACVSATSDADGYLNSSFVLPITAWGESVRSHCADMALGRIFRKRGFDPAGPDKLVVDAEKDAIKWFERIADGKLKPPEVVDATPEVFEGGGFVVVSSSRPRRGW